jgi:hypothetical protein
VPYGIDTLVNPVKPTRGQSPLNCRPLEVEFQQLVTRDHPVLAGRQNRGLRVT